MFRKILLSLVACLCAFTAVAATNHVHRVMTCNVRITGLPEDEKPGVRWDDRKQVCRDVILSKHPDIICMQEVIYDSYAYFKAQFKDYFAFGFEGPEMDPYTEGYHFIGKNVIFFRKSRYELVGAGVYWLSDEPLIGGSASWGTARARHCNWVRLRDKKSGEEFRVLDAHLDHISDTARAAQTRLIVKESAQYSQDFPQILCGDFNSGVKNLPVKTLKEASWHEMYEDVHGNDEVGYTCHAFKGEDRYDRTDGKVHGKRIDFIFARGQVKALDASIIKDAPGGIYPSDHYFLMADVQLQ